MSPIDKDKILAIAERYGARNIRVFGSVARGDDRSDSDFKINDGAVVGATGGRPYTAFAKDIGAIAGRPYGVW